MCIAVVLACLSTAFARPDVLQYADCIDWRTLAILFSLMTVMAGLGQQGVFEELCRALLARAGRMSQLIPVLVGLCFFGSMLITNDVALLTFVPFTFIVLGRIGRKTLRELAVPVVCMQTAAANLGSMLTPIGNPQNLYLYGKSGLDLRGFVKVMLPYSIASLLMLLVWGLFTGHQCNAAVSPENAGGRVWRPNRRVVTMDALLFLLCLLTVLRVVPYGVTFAAVLAGTLCLDRGVLKKVDYSLLLTFIAFFIFIGNLERITAFSQWIRQILAGHEVLTAVLASQVISNVPAALLLSGFTDKTQALMIGTNLGGLGTLIASMASLISYRQIARELPGEKGRYFRLFTASNVVLLAVLIGLWKLLGNAD